MKDRVDRLLDQLHRGDQVSKVQAIEHLGASGAKKAVRPLVQALEHALHRYEERFLVPPLVKALGNLRAHEARHVLFRALRSEFHYVKSDAAEALGHIGGNPRTVRELAKALHTTREREARKHIIDGLAEADGKQSITPLAEAAVEDPDPEVREEAVQALGRTGRTEALTPLIDAYNRASDAHIRKDVVLALSHIASAGSEEFLVHALSDSDSSIRSGAASALGEMRSPHAEIPLRRALHDPAPEVRESAAKALGMVLFLSGTECVKE